MTNPNNVTIVDLPFDIDSITTFGFVKSTFQSMLECIWLGTSNGSVFIYSTRNNQTLVPIYKFSCPNNRMNVWSIYNLRNPNVCVVLWRNKFKEIGKDEITSAVQLIYPGGIRVNIANQADIVSVFNWSNYSIFAIATVIKEVNEENKAVLKTKIVIYRFKAYVCYEAKRFYVNNKVENMEICSDSICYYTNADGYCQYFFSKEDIKNDETVEPIKLSQAPICDNHFICRVDENSFLLFYKEFMIITGKEGENGSVVQYNKKNGYPKSALVQNNNMYLFYDDYFTFGEIKQDCENEESLVFNIPNVNDFGMFGDSLVVKTNTDIRIVGSMPQPYELANKIIHKSVYEVDNILTKLSKSTCSDVVYGVFKSLWEKTYIHEALQLLSKYVLLENIVEVISLYPVLDVPERVTDLSLTPIQEDVKSYLDEYISLLLFTRNEYIKDFTKSSSSDLKIINTALAQCYSAISKCRELDMLFKEKNLHISFVENFIINSNKNHLFNTAPAWAVYQSNFGEPETAISTWRKLDDTLAKDGNYNPLFLIEASYAVQKFKSSNKLTETLAWLMNRDQNKPELAINALLSVNHDSSTVKNWLELNGLQKYRMKYYVFIASQTENKARGSEVANDTFISLIKILDEIDDPNFDIERIFFIEAFANKNDSNFKEIAKEELINITLKIFNNHSKLINSNEVLKCITEKVDKRIILAIYRENKMYTEAIDLFTKGGDFPIEDIQEFCRSSLEPEKAFSSVLNRIPQDELIVKYCTFIEDNLTYMDPIEVIKMIPNNTRIKKVEKIISMSYNILSSRIHNLENQISISKSLLRDSMFEKSNLQANYCTLQRNQKCHKCNQVILEDQICVMAPGGSDNVVYHARCKPQTK